MHTALVLLQGEATGVPTICAQAGGVVDGDAQVVAEIGTGAALLLIFGGAEGGPHAGKQNLRRRGIRQKEGRAY